MTDLKEWEKVDVKAAREVLESLDDLVRMSGVNPIGNYLFMTDFINQVELIRNKQIKNIPALLRKPE